MELVPKTCHYSNVRTTLKPKQWDLIRFKAYEDAGYVCQICGQTGLEQGYPHKLECHEIWAYNDATRVQKLIGLIALCPLCHQVKHIGRANAMGKQAEVFKQLEEVNKWSHKEIVEHVAEAFETYFERSKFEWRLDISMLTQEPYNLEFESTRKRKFKKKIGYKKKRSRKIKS